MQREPLKKLWIKVLHFLGVCFGWICFGYAWLTLDLSDADIQGLLLIIAATLVISPSITLYWIYHTLAIYRKKGERQGELKVNFNYNCDWNGLTVVADWKTLQSARFVVLQIAEGKKQYCDHTGKFSIKNS